MTKTFRKDAECCRKRGYDMELLKTAIRLLEADGQLPAIYHPHKLSGQYTGTWECHLKPNWLLIWELREFGERSKLYIKDGKGNKHCFFPK